jgi:hydroxymethylpyrimidine/phosphomethylpyrimidine kinase
MVKTALTIGGSDTSCGAGIQMDLKCFRAINIHGVSVITAVTSQTHLRVKSIKPLQASTVRTQLAVLQNDIKIDAVKTGMLYSSDIITVVANTIRKFQSKIIVDPVLTATTGRFLCTDLKRFANTLKKRLIPIATVITPNLFEAELLAERKIRTANDLKKAAQHLYELGCKYVLVKGGHFKSKYAKDLLYDGVDFKWFSAPFIGKRFHGAGCAFSAYIAGWLAKGLSVPDAVKFAKKCITQSLLHSYKLGRSGNEFLQTPFEILYRYEREFVKLKLHRCVQEFVKLLTPDLMPDVGINFVYALPYATKLKDVCGIENRIRISDKTIDYKRLKFGVSKHIATIVLTALKFDKSVRACTNLKYTLKTINACKSSGLQISCFERAQEPAGKKTMAWGTEYVIQKQGFVPDIIYDLGDTKKEPMIRIVGEEPDDVLKKVKMIIDKI